MSEPILKKINFQTITIFSIVLVVIVAAAGVWQNINLSHQQSPANVSHENVDADDFVYQDPTLTTSNELLEEITPQNFNEQLAYSWAWHQYYASTSLPEAKSRTITELANAKKMFDAGDQNATLNCFFMWDIIGDETLDADSRNLARELCHNGKQNVVYDSSFSQYWERLQKGQEQIESEQGAFWYYYPDRVVEDYTLELGEKYQNYISGNANITPEQDNTAAARQLKDYALVMIDKSDLAYGVANPNYTKDLRLKNESQLQFMALGEKLFSWYIAYGDQNFDTESKCLLREALTLYYDRFTSALEESFLTRLPICNEPSTYLVQLVNRGHYDKIEINPVLVLEDVRAGEATDNYEKIIIAGLLSQ